MTYSTICFAGGELPKFLTNQAARSSCCALSPLSHVDRDASCHLIPCILDFKIGETSSAWVLIDVLTDVTLIKWHHWSNDITFWHYVYVVCGGSLLPSLTKIWVNINHRNWGHISSWASFTVRTPTGVVAVDKSASWTSCVMWGFDFKGLLSPLCVSSSCYHCLLELPAGKPSVTRHL